MLTAGSGPANGSAGAKPDASPPRRWRGLRVAFAGIVTAAVLLAAGFLWFVHMLPSAEQRPVHRADGIVVLTGAALRINDALELLAAGYGQRVLITGVNRTTRAAEIARLVPEFRNWFDCCVDLDHSAINTIGNAVETKRWLDERGFKSLIVVTSNFHMPRAMAELSNQLPGVTLVPFAVVSERLPIDSWWSNPPTARLLFSEYLKYIAAMVRIRLEFALA
jgi:uncharacterized SAM-binding protein YcdF (DUF218 family)